MLGLDLCVRHCCLSVFLLLNGPFFCLNKKHCKYCCQSQRLRRELHSGVQHIDLISPGFFNRSMDAIKHTNHLSRSFYLRSAPHGRNALGLLTPPHLSNGWSCFVRLRLIAGCSRGLRSRSLLEWHRCPFSGSTVGVFAIVNHALNTPHSLFPMGGWVCTCASKQVCVVYSVAWAAHSKTFTLATFPRVWKRLWRPRKCPKCVCFLKCVCLNKLVNKPVGA